MEKEPEIWLPILNYEGLYEISSWGNVKSLARSGTTGSILVIRIDRGKYLYVGLSKSNICIKYKVHRLVAIHFIDNPENKPDVDHDDTDRSNNYYKNLKWATKKENSNNPRTKKNHSISKMGELNPMKAKRRKIYQLDLSGNFIKEWTGIKETADYLGIQHSGISRCCNNKMAFCGGFIWSFVDPREKVPS